MKGIASLPAILLIGGVIVELAIIGSFLALLFINIQFGARLAAEAIAAAQSGAADALMRLVRDKNLTDNYTLTVGERSADITICKDICDGEPLTGKDKITIIGKAGTRQHKVVVIAAVDGTTGRVTIESVND